MYVELNYFNSTWKEYLIILQCFLKGSALLTIKVNPLNLRKLNKQ